MKCEILGMTRKRKRKKKPAMLRIQNVKRKRIRNKRKQGKDACFNGVRIDRKVGQHRHNKSI